MGTIYHIFRILIVTSAPPPLVIISIAITVILFDGIFLIAGTFTIIDVFIDAFFIINIFTCVFIHPIRLVITVVSADIIGLFNITIFFLIVRCNVAVATTNISIFHTVAIAVIVAC